MLFVYNHVGTSFHCTKTIASETKDNSNAKKKKKEKEKNKKMRKRKNKKKEKLRVLLKKRIYFIFV
jgi:hypothetical protein